MVVLYDNNEIIGDVDCKYNLDYLHGSNFQNGGVGKHLGFGRFKEKWFLLFGTNWQNQHDRAEIVEPRRIVQEAIKSDNHDEIEDYPELWKIYESEFLDKEILDTKTFSIRVNLKEPSESIEKKLSEMKQKITDYKNLM